MNSRERVLRTLNHQSFDRAPRDLWVSPEIADGCCDEVAEIHTRYPNDILILNERPSVTDGLQKPAVSPLANVPEGDAVAKAYELLQALVGKLFAAERFACVNPTCNATGRFTLAWCDAGPFVRIHALQGLAVSQDLHSKDKAVRDLLARMHDLHCRELKLWCQTHADAVAMADEMVLTSANHAATKLWRTTFKPLLREYCKIVHDHDKFLFLYCTRAADELLEDLVEIGVDAVHIPYGGDPERIADSLRRRITFWGGMDPLPSQTKNAQRLIAERVLKMRRALDYGAGGVIAHCHWQPQVPLLNVAAFYENWMIPVRLEV
jgi:hypothetical protein